MFTSSDSSRLVISSSSFDELIFSKLSSKFSLIISVISSSSRDISSIDSLESKLTSTSSYFSLSIIFES